MIFEATERDIQGVLEIYNDAILHTTAIYAYKEYTLEDRLAWYVQKVEGGYPLYVYKEEEKVLGYATYGPFRPFPAFQYTIEHSVYVHPEARGRGIAKRLLEKLIERAKEQGYKMMVAGIDSENEISIKIHEKLGFTYCGTIHKSGYKFGRWLNLAFYELELEGPVEPKDC